MAWNHKHLLDIESLSAEDIVTVLDTAKAFKAVGERAIKKVPALRGKTVVNLFVEPSTRTRISFRTGGTALDGGHHQFHRRSVFVEKGRNAQGHGAEPGSPER